MTYNEFITVMKSRGAVIAPPATRTDITLANTALQSIRAAMLPKIMIELYEQTDGINLGAGYIFGPNEIARVRRFPVPSITSVNNDISTNASMRGKTVFGRNDLFWFAFDAMGTFYMLDNLTLKPLRKYDDPYRALTDCLIAGKI